MLADAESDALHARVRALVVAFQEGREGPEPFDALAVDIARFQAERVPGIARLHRAAGSDPLALRSAHEVPSVPTDAFKHVRIATFPAWPGETVFRTSGTTLTVRGTHVFRTTSTYDAAALAFGAHALFAGLSEPPAAVVLAPPFTEARDSSLGHMMQHFVEELTSTPPGARTHFVEGDTIAHDALEARLDALVAEGRPVVVLGTSFAFVHWLDARTRSATPLPPGSRVMQTGGTKGKSREVSPGELRARVAVALGVGEGSVVSEYGMTELSSQFYEGTLLGTGEGVHVEPPWARVVPVHPETLAPVAFGEEGLARIEDLANVDSAVAIQTQDRVVRVPGGFRLLGRAKGAPPRGCSIAIDELLARGGT